jgi:hypothetical protein
MDSSHYIIGQITTLLDTIIASNLPSRDTRAKFIERHQTFLKVLMSYIGFNETDLKALLLYVNRLLKIPKEVYLDKCNCNYVLLCLVVMYMKMYYDHYYSNAYFCQIFKTKLKVLNATEGRLINKLDLFITQEDLRNLQISFKS